MSVDIVDLGSNAARDRAFSGGKGGSLADLLAAGFPVPGGFVVGAHTFARHLASLGLDVAIAAILDPRGPHAIEAIEAAARRLEERLLAAELPPALAAEIACRVENAEIRWAVRSSGIAEDLADASFAGQYETVLGARGPIEIAAAVRRCWASFLAPRSLHYRKQRGIREISGAVVVQRLVAADVAGVAFTVDPLTALGDRIVISANYGLGESVALGLVTPDSFVVHKDGGAILRRDLGDKRLRTVIHDGRAVSEALDARDRERLSLSDDEVAMVAGLARRVEASHAAPVDMEWALSAGQVHLLQARPITAIEPVRDAAFAPELQSAIDPRYPIYSSGNVGEILPGCVTPLTWSLLGPGLDRAFRDVFESLGAIDDVGAAPVVALFYHRLYLNVSYFMEVAIHSPGGSPASVLEELVGAGDIEAPEVSSWRFLAPRRFVRGARIVRRFLAMQRGLDQEIGEALACVERSRTRWSRLEGVPLEALMAPPSAEEQRAATVHIRASQCAVTSFGALRKMTRDLLGDATGALAATLVTGIGSLASAEPAFELHELAELVKKSEELALAFERERDDQLLCAELKGSRANAAGYFCDRLEGFLARFGHRGMRELELAGPSWRESPGEVLGHVRNYLAPGSIAPADVLARQERAAAEALDRALAALPRFRRRSFLALVDRTRRHIAARERMKNAVLQMWEPYRWRCRVARADLVARGFLEREDDLYYLVSEELQRIGRGELDQPAVRAIVTRRRRELAICRRLVVPKVQRGAPRFVANEDAPARGTRMAGIAVSPGIAEGRARVVLDPRSDAALEPGEVLIAPHTDLAWTPLFLNAAAIVVEVGGPLSHGSIVAREYGTPAVVAVAGATRAIRTGDRVRVDGDRGFVTIIPAEESESSPAPPSKQRHVLFVSLPAFGHLGPLLVQGRELRRRGWRVSIASTQEARRYLDGRIDGMDFVDLGSGGVPIPEAMAVIDRVSAEPNFAKGSLEAFKLMNRAWPAMYDGITAAIRRVQPDLMVVDFATHAALDAAEVAQVPCIVNNADLLGVLPDGVLPPAPHVPRLFSQRSIHDVGRLDRLLDPMARVIARRLAQLTVGRLVNENRRARNLPALDYHDRLKDKLVLVNSCFGLEYERPLPPQVQMVGPMLSDGEPPLPADIDAWLREGPPVVYVNFGTIAAPSPEHVRKLAEGLAGTELRALWVLRDEGQAHLPVDLARNIRVERWVPSQIGVLGHPNVRVFVSHCGTNSVQESLHAGTPIVGFPMFVAQRDMAQRVSDAGVGVFLDKHTFTPDELRAAVLCVMHDDSFRTATVAIRASFARAGGVRRAADLIERLANTALTND